MLWDVSVRLLQCCGLFRLGSCPVVGPCRHVVDYCGPVVEDFGLFWGCCGSFWLVLVRRGKVCGFLRF